MAYTENDLDLHTHRENGLDPVPGWLNIAWIPDSQGLLLSGRSHSNTCDLIWISRVEQTLHYWITGKVESLYVYDAIPMVSGVAFLATCGHCRMDEARLYLGRLDQGDFRWSLVGPMKLCRRLDSFGNPNAPLYIAWNPDKPTGILTCGINEIYSLEMNDKNVTLEDILPFFPSQ